MTLTATRPPPARPRQRRLPRPRRRRHLRGGQRSDADGAVTFKTIYPGWYPGRTAHIHLKVHVTGDEVQTGQLFFDDSVSARVHADSDYGRGDQDVSGDQDGIRQEAVDASTLALTRKGDGYVGSLTLGVQVA